MFFSNDALYACRIPLASFESWDFGPKIGLDGLDSLAQVSSPLPLDDTTSCMCTIALPSSASPFFSPFVVVHKSLAPAGDQHGPRSDAVRLADPCSRRQQPFRAEQG